MPDISIKLSNTARSVLTLATARDDRLVRIPQLPIAAARQVIRSLLNAGLVEEIPAPIEDAEFAWRVAEDGVALTLRATAAGLARVSEPAAAELPLTDEDREATETLASAEPGSVGLDIASQPTESVTGPLPASVADALDDRDEVVTRVTIEIEASIAPLVNAFVCELMKPERVPYVSAFVRR